MKCLYPAIISYDQAGKCYYVKFPDIEGCVTDGKDLYEAYENAEDAVNLMLSSLEEVPRPSSKSEIKCCEGEEIVYFRVDTEGYKKYMDMIKYFELQKELITQFSRESLPVIVS